MQSPAGDGHFPHEGVSSQHAYDEDNPFYLHHSDNPDTVLVSQPLTGENYEVWHRAMIIALAAKNKLGFVDGFIPKPTSPKSLVVSWGRCNNMVLSWLLNSLHKTLSSIVVFANNAVHVWTELKIRFSQSNAPRLYQIQMQIINCKQLQCSISVYYTQLKSLWDEYNSYVILPTYDCGAMRQVKEIYEQQRLLEFLMGLNESYTAIRSQILLMEPSPSIPRAYALLVQEERQREVHVSLPSESISAI
ncbi:uncharacterized protein LOC116265326 [Nymphaea colorata]|uniref:uncharacterized protein LOC116265326 n=1 Tax=Nymphaea colorata TaxID=210225 RepID=UPI00129D4790|nr:uncharacterized protein LOC116265326 [Nymphaea colorata]